MVPSVEKKIDELEMGLLHLQQNIDIPEITLVVHPVVSAVIKKCAEEGRKPKVPDFGERVEDSSFLNQLQNGVNRWIKEIQKVSHIFLWMILDNITIGRSMGGFLQTMPVNYLPAYLTILASSVWIFLVFFHHGMFYLILDDRITGHETGP